MKTIISLLIPTLLLVSCQQKKIKTKTRKQIPNATFDKALDYRDRGNLDSAFVYYNKAKDIAIIDRDSVTTAKSLINMAAIFDQAGDHFSCQELALEAISYLDTTKLGERAFLSSAYNSLGISTASLDHLEDATGFYKQALHFAESTDDYELYCNDLGVNLSYQKRYEEALNYLYKIIRNKKSPEYARALSNIGKVKWLQNANFNPLPLFLEALSIRKKANNLWGQNASYAHLADYYIATKSDSALIYANKMYDVAREIESPDDQLEALQKIVKLSSGEQSKRYFEIYRKLEDSVQTARNAAKNQFALIRYQTEKHKADNLVLQKKNTEKTYQLGIVATIALLSSAGGLVWYRKRQQKMKLESENLIQENKLKTSKKVHDVVANGLYRVMTEIENGDALDREDLLDKIDDMYQKSRDISYDKPVSTNAPVGFYERLGAMINSFRSADVTVTQTGHTAAFWTGVAPETKHELEHVLQELLVNMDKHSSASQVELHFLRTNTGATISYQDNGIGLPKDVHFNNGLSSTENRIQNISGTITFEKNAPSGLEILISFPCSN